METQTNVIAAGIITFRLTKDEFIEVLTLDHGSHISHPKGHVESDESLSDTAIRELQEETDLTVVVMSLEPIYTGNYEYELDSKKISKVVHYYAGISHRDEQVRISKEHQGFQWSDVRAAKRLITYEADIRALEEAVNWLIDNNSTPIITARRLSLL